MKRYILIDNASGYIWGDTADYIACDAFLSSRWTGSVIGAVRMLDEGIGCEPREYVEHGPTFRASDGYTVYSADDPEDDIPIIDDGQAQHATDAVTAWCPTIAVVTW